MRGKYIWRISQEYGGTCYVADVGGLRLLVIGSPIHLVAGHEIQKRTPNAYGKWGGGVIVNPMNKIGVYEFQDDFCEFIDDCDTVPEAMVQAVRAYGRVLSRLNNEIGHQLIKSTYNESLPDHTLDDLTKMRLEFEDSQDRVRAAEPKKELPPPKPASPPVQPRYQVCNYCGLQNRFHPPAYPDKNSPVRLCAGGILHI